MAIGTATGLARGGGAAAAQDAQDSGGETDCWSFRRATSGERPGAERFIRDGYRQAYGARLAGVMPTLMVLRRDGRIAAACGLRPAASDTLFLEIYLDQPVESAIAAAAGIAVTRGEVVEVGNLVIARAGYARELIARLTEWLHAQGPAWVVFSAVPALRNNFHRLRIPLVGLAAADGRRLGAAALSEWGTYYDQAPYVFAVRVDAALLAVRGCA